MRIIYIENIFFLVIEEAVKTHVSIPFLSLELCFEILVVAISLIVMSFGSILLFSYALLFFRFLCRKKHLHHLSNWNLLLTINYYWNNIFWRIHLLSTARIHISESRIHSNFVLFVRTGVKMKRICFT